MSRHKQSLQLVKQPVMPETNRLAYVIKIFFLFVIFCILDYNRSRYIATSFTDGFSGDERPPSFLALSGISFQIY
jgi:hypothetical protein